MKISQKKIFLKKCVGAFLAAIFSQEACLLAEKEEEKRVHAIFTDQLFLSDLDGTNSILPNFSF